MAEATNQATLNAKYPADGICRVLSLDGGGAKGFYTLGVLKEIEGMINCRLHERFDPNIRDKHGRNHRRSIKSRPYGR